MAAVVASCSFLYAAYPATVTDQYLRAVGADYMSALVDKHQRAASMPPPRVLLIGGSSLAFGVDSQALESAIGLPVLNMGTNAGLGLRFVLEDAERMLEKGDVVVLSLEYEMSMDGEPDIVTRATEVSRSESLSMAASIHLLWVQAGVRLGSTVKQVQEAFRLTITPRASLALQPKAPVFNAIYRRSGFDAYGDFVGHLDQGAALKAIAVDRVAWKEYEWTNVIATRIDYINRWAARVRAKGATVFWLYPTYLRSAYQINRGYIQALARQIDLRLMVDVLNTPETFLADESESYDTVYHRNRSGRARYTRKMGEIVAAWLGRHGARAQ